MVFEIFSDLQVEEFFGSLIFFSFIFFVMLFSGFLLRDNSMIIESYNERASSN